MDISRPAVLISSVAIFALGCSSGSDSSPEMAPLTLTITDAPVNLAEVDQVCVDFNRITLHYAGEDDVLLDYNPLPSQVRSETHCTTGTWDGTLPVPPIKLDALGGPLTVALAESMQVPVGRITWIRLHFTGGSFVRDDLGGEHDLRCPSCDVTDNNDGRGFKLNRAFAVTTEGLAVTVDVDLHKSLHQNASGYVLRPTARIEVDETLGTIAGDVHEGIINSAGGMPFSGTDVDTGCAVYIYAGHDTTPEDHYDGSTVISTARVRYDLASGLYGYAAGALFGGTEGAPERYTAALTCDGDDPLVNELDTEVVFTEGQNADVVARQTETINFLP